MVHKHEYKEMTRIELDRFEKIDGKRYYEGFNCSCGYPLLIENEPFNMIIKKQ